MKEVVVSEFAKLDSVLFISTFVSKSSKTWLTSKVLPTLHEFAQTTYSVVLQIGSFGRQAIMNLSLKQYAEFLTRIGRGQEVSMKISLHAYLNCCFESSPSALWPRVGFDRFRLDCSTYYLLLNTKCHTKY